MDRFGKVGEEMVALGNIITGASRMNGYATIKSYDITSILIDNTAPKNVWEEGHSLASIMRGCAQHFDNIYQYTTELYRRHDDLYVRIGCDSLTLQQEIEGLKILDEIGNVVDIKSSKKMIEELKKISKFYARCAMLDNKKIKTKYLVDYAQNFVSEFDKLMAEKLDLQFVLDADSSKIPDWTEIRRVSTGEIILEKPQDDFCLAPNF